MKKNSVYGDEAWKTLTKKIPAVLHFLRVLQASMRWEQSRRPDFLGANKIEGLVPDLDAIARNLLVGIGRVLGSFEGRFLDPNPIHIWKELARDASFDEFFRTYGESETLITSTC